jgi:hypothetical protein
MSATTSKHNTIKAASLVGFNKVMAALTVGAPFSWPPCTIKPSNRQISFGGL